MVRTDLLWPSVIIIIVAIVVIAITVPTVPVVATVRVKGTAVIAPDSAAKIIVVVMIVVDGDNPAVLDRGHASVSDAGTGAPFMSLCTARQCRPAEQDGSHHETMSLQHRVSSRFGFGR